MSETIPIIFAANDYYVPYISVMLASLLDHASKARHYEIILLSSGLSDETHERFEKQISAYDHFSLRFLDVSDTISSGDFFTENQNTSIFTKEAYYRLFVPFMLPEYDKAIYLDGDKIALRDIGLLWDIPLGENYIAAVRDYCGLADMYDPDSDRMQYMINVLQLKNPNDYFISGLLLMNLERFRADYTEEQMFSIATGREWRFHDQDILNVLTQENSILLDSRWNVLQDYGKHHFMPAPLYNEWHESTRDPHVIHYGGPYKPWNSPKVPFRQYFWKYAAQSDYLGLIKDRRRAEINKSPRSWLKYWSQYLFPLQSRSREAVKRVIAPLLN